MATASSVLDDLIKEYLLFRGFTSTLKSFENDIKADKDKSYKVNRIMDQLLAYVATYDISSLREYWEHLDKRFFKRLDHQHYNNVRKLETCLLRLYVVHALQNSKQDKVTEFFERYVTELQPQTDWREWFAIPFIKNPEQNTTFEMYFQKSWQETFYLSLHNFLITVFYHLPMPTLLHYDKERGFQQKLEEQVTKLKQQVVDLADQITDLQRKNSRLTTELDERKYQTGETVVEEEDEEFYVIQKPKSVFSQITKVFPKKPKEKIKKNIKIQRQTDVNNQGKIIQQKQQVVKQQELEIPQEAQDQERPLSDIEEEHKTSQPISNTITTEEHKNICKTYSGEPSPLAKSLSFDSGVKVYSKDDTDSALTRTSTMPSNTSLGSTLPRDSKLDDLLQPKIVRFDADNDQQRPFIHLGQEEYKEHHSGVVHCRFSSSGRVIASSDSDGIVKVWTNHPDIRTCATLMSKSPLLSLEWASKPERLLLLGTGHGKVRFYDTDNKKTICDVSTDSLYPRIVSLSCSPTGTAFVCSAATSKKPASQMSSSLRLGSNVKGRPGDVMSSSSNGKSSSDGVLQCWDMKNMKVERNLPVDPTPVCINCTAYNHNGTLLVSGGADGMIRLFDMRSYDCLMGMHAHDGEVCCVQFSVDETTIYSMGLDGKFIQWSVHRMGQKIADLNIHEGAVLKSSLRPNQSRGINGGGSYGRLFAFDSEGQHVLTCGPQSGLIYKVDGKNLSQVLSLPYHRQHVMSVDWTSSLSCSTCLTGSLDGSIQITSLLKQ